MKSLKNYFSIVGITLDQQCLANFFIQIAIYCVFENFLQNLTSGISIPLNMMKTAPISSKILGARFK